MCLTFLSLPLYHFYIWQARWYEINYKKHLVIHYLSFLHLYNIGLTFWYIVLSKLHLIVERFYHIIDFFDCCIILIKEFRIFCLCEVLMLWLICFWLILQHSHLTNHGDEGEMGSLWELLNHLSAVYRFQIHSMKLWRAKFKVLAYRY